MSQLKTTLRSHTDPVTALEFYYCRNEYFSTSSLLTPTLISADETGNITWWDLTTRRPISGWKAHDASVLSVRQLGVRWANSKDGLEPEIGALYGFLITHSRDNTLKIWNMNEPGKLELTEPINSLNFCNIDVIGTQLVSLNRLDSQTFDVQQIEALGHGLEPRLDSISPEILIKQVKVDKPAKLGIIMKMVWVSREILYLGLEGGHVIGLYVPYGDKSLVYIDEKKVVELEKMMGREDLQQQYLEAAQGKVTEMAHLLYGDTTSSTGIKVISYNSVHYPSPILDIKYDVVNNKVLSTSTGSKLVIHEVGEARAPDSPVSENEDIHGVVDLKSIGGSSIDIRNDNVLAITFWNGFTKFYKIGPGYSVEKSGVKISKPKPGVMKEFSSNPNDPEILANEKQVRRFKLTLVKMSAQGNASHVTVADYKAKNVKDLMSYRRFLKTFSDSWVAIGHDDGCIGVYEVAG